MPLKVWLTAKEINARMKNTRAKTVAKTLKRLHDWKDVERRVRRGTQRGPAFEYRKVVT